MEPSTGSRVKTPEIVEEKTLLDQREKERDHPLSAQLEIQDFLKLLQGDLTHEPEAPVNPCEPTPRERKKGRMVQIEPGWFER